jgi:hyperosmotically inducible periplasmic protein
MFIISLAFLSFSASTLDTRIEDAAQNSYVWKSYLKNDDISVNSEDSGHVTLTGTVTEESHKSLAVEAVAALPGVKSVRDDLNVKQESSAAKGVSDTWLGAKIKTLLLFHENSNAAKTDVYVKDGIVTLKGTAESRAQKDLTTEYVRNVSGVKGVENEMKVVEVYGASRTISEKIDDASITAQVKTALLFNKGTSAIRTKVLTRDGVVMLSGQAKNVAEKELVTKVASEVRGVVRVVNNMSVEGTLSSIFE